MIYLVDYENVNLYGMTGIEKLTAEDQVVVFLGNTMGAIPFEWHIRILDAPTKVKYIKCGKVSKNYLDFQLATYCGYLMAGLESEKVFIISKDKGFDSVIDFWTEHKEQIKISRVETIDESLGIIPETAKQEKEEKVESQEYSERNQRSRRISQRSRGRRGYINRQNEGERSTEAAQDTPKEAKNEADTEVETEIRVPGEEMQPEVKKETQVQEEEIQPEVKKGAQVQEEEIQPEAKKETQVQEEEIQPEVKKETQLQEEEMKAEETEVKVQETEMNQPVRKRKLSEGIKKRIRLKVKDEELKGGSYKTIYNIFINESAKNRFNTALVKAFQQEKGNRIYKKLLPEFEEHLKEQ